MEKVKKLWKELSVFGIVIVIFLGLFVFRKIAFVEFSTISESKLVEKIKDKDSFVVVVGSDNDNATLNYKEIMKTFVEKNRSESLYYVDLSSNKDMAAFIKETFKSDDATIPQTLVIENGEVKVQKSGLLSYYQLYQLYK